MRLDELLKVSCPIKRRAVTNEACNTGRVPVSDKPVKTSASVKTGGIIETQFGAEAVKVEVLNV